MKNLLLVFLFFAATLVNAQINNISIYGMDDSKSAEVFSKETFKSVTFKETGDKTACTNLLTATVKNFPKMIGAPYCKLMNGQYGFTINYLP